MPDQASQDASHHAHLAIVLGVLRDALPLHAQPAHIVVDLPDLPDAFHSQHFEVCAYECVVRTHRSVIWSLFMPSVLIMAQVYHEFVRRNESDIKEFMFCLVHLVVWFIFIKYYSKHKAMMYVF